MRKHEAAVTPHVNDKVTQDGDGREGRDVEVGERQFESLYIKNFNIVRSFYTF